MIIKSQWWGGGTWAQRRLLWNSWTHFLLNWHKISFVWDAQRAHNMKQCLHRMVIQYSSEHNWLCVCWLSSWMSLKNKRNNTDLSNLVRGNHCTIMHRYRGAQKEKRFSLRLERHKNKLGIQNSGGGGGFLKL